MQLTPPVFKHWSCSHVYIGLLLMHSVILQYGNIAWNIASRGENVKSDSKLIKLISIKQIIILMNKDAAR